MVKRLAPTDTPTPKSHPKGAEVWMPHPKITWVKGEVTAWDEKTGKVSVRSKDATRHVMNNIPPAKIAPVNRMDSNGVSDCCSLMFLHEPSLLDNVKTRYAADKIYTYVERILIAVNPYKRVPGLVSPSLMDEYKGKAIGLLEPHVYAVADHAYRQLKSKNMNQSILISGESGAGKTETAKIVLQYLTHIAGHGGLGASSGVLGGVGSEATLERKILEANVIMEAFGNAKTLRNNNSSRFGKFTEIHFDKSWRVDGSSMVTYLLERSRLVAQAKNERNYHIFYYLLAGAPPTEKSSLHLSAPKTFHYLNQSNCYEVSGVNDGDEFGAVVASMKTLGFTASEIADVWKVVSAVLHIGNVDFKPEKIGSAEGVNIANESTHLKWAAELIGIPADELRDKLTLRTMTSGRRGRGTTYTIPLKMEQATFNRDGFAKYIYARLFDWLVGRINNAMRGAPPTGPNGTYERTISVLDIYGFENFQHNSFEQFCINYANESLQQHFNWQVLVADQEIYKSEGIPWQEIEFDDNADTLEVIESKGKGLLALLDEQASMPKATDATFTEKLHNSHPKHKKMTPARQGGFKGYRENEAFVIKHFAGPVCYETKGFLDKNNDDLTTDLRSLIAISSMPFFTSLFPPVPEDAAGRKAKTSLSKKFSSQLRQLMDYLSTTESHFIRCIKPNTVQRPGVFEPTMVIDQLRFSGMVATLKVFALGYPTRALYVDLHGRYKKHLPKDIATLKERDFTEALVMGLGIDRQDFALGLKRIFFRAGQMAFLDDLMNNFAEKAHEIIPKIRKFLRRKRFRRAIWAVLAYVVFRDTLNEARDKVRFEKAKKHFPDGIPLESELKVWFNTALHNARYRRAVTNFGTDLSDGEKYIILLAQLEPEVADTKGLKETNPKRRADAIIKTAGKFGCAPSWFSADDILRGSKGMNRLFIAQLYLAHPDIAPSEQEQEAVRKAEELASHMKEMEEKLKRERDAERQRVAQEVSNEKKRREEAERAAAAATASAESTISDLRGELAATKTKLADALAAAQTLRDQLASAQRDLETQKGALSSAQSELKHMQTEVAEEHQAALEQLRSNMKSMEQDKEERLQRIKEEADAKERALAVKEGEKDDVVRALQSVESKLDVMTSERDDYRSKARAAEEELHTIKLSAIDEKSNATMKMTDLEGQIADLEDALRTTKSANGRALDDERRKASELDVALTAARKENATLRSTAKDLKESLDEALDDLAEANEARAADFAAMEKKISEVSQLLVKNAEEAKKPKIAMTQMVEDMKAFRPLLVRPEKRGWVLRQATLFGALMPMWPQRYCVLRNNYLSFYVDDQDLSEPVGALDLAACTVSRVPSAAVGKPHCFALRLIETDVVTYGAASSEEELNEWMAYMQESVVRDIKAREVYEALSGGGAAGGENPFANLKGEKQDAWVSNGKGSLRIHGGDSGIPLPPSAPSGPRRRPAIPVAPETSASTEGQGRRKSTKRSGSRRRSAKRPTAT